MEQKEFYKILDKILEQMETKSEDHPDDINALLNKLIYQSEASENVKLKLTIARQKFQECKMWVEKIAEDLSKFD